MTGWFSVAFFVSPSFKSLSKWGEEILTIPQHQFWYVDDLRRLVTRVRTSCSFVHSFPSSMLKFWGCICQVVLLRFVCIGCKKYKQQYSPKLCFKEVTKNIQTSWQKGSRLFEWIQSFMTSTPRPCWECIFSRFLRVFYVFLYLLKRYLEH